MAGASFAFRFGKYRTEFICLVLFFLWAFFLFHRYFLAPSDEFAILRQAFSIPPGSSSLSNPPHWSSTLGSFLKVMGTSLAAGFVTIRLGFFLRTWLGITSPNLPAEWAIDFGFGVFLIDGLWLGLGFNQLWYTPFLKFSFGFLFLACVLEKMTRFSMPPVKGIRLPDWPYALLALVGLGYGLFSCAHGFLPETHTDGLNYHLGIPCNWLTRHGIGNFTSSYYDGFPYGGELFLLTGYLFQGTEAAKFLNVLVATVCALAAAGWAWESGGRNAGWLALGLTLTMPLLALVSWTTQIEGFLVLFSVLFFHGLYRLIKDDGERALDPYVLSTGLWGGMVLSVKYTGILGIGVGLLLFPVFLRAGREFLPKRYFLLCSLLVGMDAVWLLKNWIFLKTPFFPYFQNLFHGGPASWFNTDTADVNFVPWDWYRLVWTLPMSKPSLFGFTGPLLILFIPAALLFKTQEREWKWVGWSLAVLCPVCLAFLTILKFHLPEIILFYIFCSVLFAGERNRYWGKSAALLSAVSAVLCFPYLAGLSSIYYSGYPVWTSRENRDQYLERRLTYYGSCEFASENLREDSKLLLIGVQDVYFPFESYPDLGYFKGVFQTVDSVDKAFSRVRQAGYTHVVFNLLPLRSANFYLNFTLSPFQWRLFDDYFRRGLEPVYEKGPVAIFRIRPQLEPKGDPTTVDPFLFCSEPASGYLSSVERGDLGKARFYLEQSLRLYPFSDYWKTQEKRLMGKKP